MSSALQDNVSASVVVPPPPQKPPSRSSSSANLTLAAAGGGGNTPTSGKPRIPPVLSRPSTPGPSQGPSPGASQPRQDANVSSIKYVTSVTTFEHQPSSSSASATAPARQQQQSTYGMPLEGVRHSESGALLPVGSQPAAPLPGSAVRQLSAASIDRESLRPSASSGFRPVTPVRAVSSATEGMHYAQRQGDSLAGSGRTPGAVFRRALSPSKEQVPRPTFSPSVNWMTEQVPRFKYEPPPMLPHYYDVHQCAATPVDERRSRGHDAEARRRIPPDERWGPPVRVLPNRFNSVPEDDNDGYARVGSEHPAAAEQPMRRSGRHGREDTAAHPPSDVWRDEVDHLLRSERRSRRQSPRVALDEDSSQRAGAPRGGTRDSAYRDISQVRGNPLREEDYYDAAGAAAGERRVHRHSSRAHRAHHTSSYYPEYDAVVPRSPHEDVTPRSRHHRSSRHREAYDDYRSDRRAKQESGRYDAAASPDSYVIVGGKLRRHEEGSMDDSSVAQGGNTVSRRHPDESEDAYRARRRAEREQRRMMSR